MFFNIFIIYLLLFFCVLLYAIISFLNIRLFRKFSNFFFVKHV